MMMSRRTMNAVYGEWETSQYHFQLFNPGFAHDILRDAIEAWLAIPRTISSWPLEEDGGPIEHVCIEPGL